MPLDCCSQLDKKNRVKSDSHLLSPSLSFFTETVMQRFSILTSITQSELLQLNVCSQWCRQLNYTISVIQLILCVCVWCLFCFCIPLDCICYDTKHWDDVFIQQLAHSTGNLFLTCYCMLYVERPLSSSLWTQALTWQVDHYVLRNQVQFFIKLKEGYTMVETECSSEIWS